VENIHALFTRASVEREHLTPADVGVKRIGHFGFFRPEHKDRLWRRSVDGMVAHIAQRQVVALPGVLAAGERFTDPQR